MKLHFHKDEYITPPSSLKQSLSHPYHGDRKSIEIWKCNTNCVIGLKCGIYTLRFTYLTDSESNNFDSFFALGLGHTYYRLPPIMEFYLIKH